MLDGALRGKAASPTLRKTCECANLPNRLAPLRPRALAGEQGAGGMRGPTARKAVFVLAQRAALFFRVCKPPDLGGNQSKGVYCDTSLRLPFDPIRSNRAGLFKFLAVGCGLNEIAPSAISDVDFGPSGNRNSNESSLCMWFLPWDRIPACH